LLKWILTGALAAIVVMPMLAEAGILNFFKLDDVKWGLNLESLLTQDIKLDPIWKGIEEKTRVFADGSVGCENATFEANNTDKSLQLRFNYKSSILNKMTPFIILENGQKRYIRDLLRRNSKVGNWLWIE